MKIGTWLISLLSPAISKIFALLGFSLVSIVGFDVVLNTARDRLLSTVGAVPAGMLDLFLIAGGGKALSMIIAAIAVRLLLWKIQSATKILGVNPG